MTVPKWMKDIVENENMIASFHLQGEKIDEQIKSRRRDEFANKIADLVVKKLNKN